jgi:hypothetical protein
MSFLASNFHVTYDLEENLLRGEKVKGVWTGRRLPLWTFILTLESTVNYGDHGKLCGTPEYCFNQFFADRSSVYTLAAISPDQTKCARCFPVTLLSGTIGGQ